MKSDNRNKTALVLAGGGLSGAVYEIGALRAIDDLLVDRTVNDFDILVGTSAGALVAALLTNGISPEEMLCVIEGTNTELAPIKRQDLFSIDRRDYLRSGLRLPLRLGHIGWNYLRHPQRASLFDVLWSMTEALPHGLYDGMALERYVRQIINTVGQHNDFRKLQRNLFIIATELDSGRRAVFGCGQIEDATVSEAVAASSALPLLYKPVRIGNHEYVDGGMRGNASLDLAIEQGATLVVCINPLVPYEKDQQQESPFEGSNFLSSKGLQSIANQSIRILTHAGLQYHIKQLRRSHPEVDIILIEPRREDYQMFYNNIMHYPSRLAIARHGFESVTLDLAMYYEVYKQILARHGIPISRRLVINELARIAASNYDPQVIREVLEARQPGCGQQRNDTPLCELSRTLAELDMILDAVEEGTLDM